MKPEYLVYALTALAVVVVVLTRVRLSQAEAAGQHQVGMLAVNLHTVCGAIGALLWVAFLVAESGVLGVVGLFFLWLTVLAGLMILARWVPSGGKHASGSTDDSWSEGPGLSILAHAGMLVGVSVFTWFFATH